MTMGDEVKFKLHVDEFQRAADRLAHYSKRDGETFMKEQVRGFIRHLLDLTPPSRGSTRGVKAKKLGEQAIVGDIRAVFRGVSDPKRADVDSMAQMRSMLKSRRNSGSMRVAKGGTKLKAPKALIAELIKAKKARVGYLASAWATAALSVGKIRVPAWVSRHAAPGSTDITGEGWRDQRVDHQRRGVGRQGQRPAGAGECRAPGADPFDGKTAALFLRQREGEVRLRLTCHPWPDGQAHRTADTQHGWIPVRVEDVPSRKPAG